MWSLFALLIGFVMDLLLGDPHRIPHPVVAIGKLISLLEKFLRRKLPSTEKGEILAGGLLWLIVVLLSGGIPALLLWGLHSISPWLRLPVESIMCWQILAARSLRDESMKVYQALKSGNIKRARYAVSMIVGRDTDRLDEAGITRAAVETVAENSSDGVIAPLLFMIIGGAPLGFFYKGVNTMDSMLGYTDPPYKNIGLIPARADDVLNFIPARISALFLLLAGWELNLLQQRGIGKDHFQFDLRNGWRIFCRDRYQHASPNSAQTESVCAGLLRLQLAGDAWYHGNLHKKPFIGDPFRGIEKEDIPRSCRLMYGAAVSGLIICSVIKVLMLVL